MEEPELEEGEACYYKDDASIDPDIALSYIDEKVQNVLGHFQKDFEGGVSAENLGAKFGGYGSFLPTYQRSPSVRSHPKTPQRAQNHNTPRSPNNCHAEGAPSDSMVPSDALSSLSIGTASRSMHSLHNPKVATADVSAKKESCLLVAQTTEKLPLKHEPSSSKLVNPTDQRTLRVRIKVGSDNTVPKNAAIYSGLGLISPSSSMGNSPDESGGVPFESQGTPDESPASILQSMTSFLVPGGLLLSPLHDSLLCFIRKKNISLDSKPAPPFKDWQQDSAMLFDDSASTMGEEKVLKTKETVSVGKTKTLEKCESGMDFEESMASHLKKKTETETLDSKQCLSNDFKLNPLSISICDTGDSLKGAVMAPEAYREAKKEIPVKKREINKDWLKDSLLSTDLVKEEFSVSMNGHGGGKYEQKDSKSSSMEKIGQHRVRSSHKDVSVDLTEGGRSKDNRVLAPVKADTDVSKCEKDSNAGAMDHHKPKVGLKATLHEQDELKMPHSTKKLSFEGKKKSKGNQSIGKLASDLTEQSLRSGVCAAPKDKKSVQEDVRKVRNSYEDVLDISLEHATNQMNPMERAFGDRTKEHSFEDVKEKEGPNVGPPAEGLSSEMESALVAPLVIDEWVCCDLCQKWRLLPHGTKPEHLPEKWLCSMLNWLPGMNNCDISEDETTKALNALYELPLPKSQNNLAEGTAPGVTSADVRHFNQSYPNLNCAMPNRGKKKHKARETPNTASRCGLIQTSNFTKNFQQEVLKSRSLNDMNQPLLETKTINKSTVQGPSKSCNFAVERHVDKLKEKHVNGGYTKQKKLKSKREFYQCGYENVKKIKTEDPLYTEKCWTSEHGKDLGRVGFSSSTTLTTRAAGEDMQKPNEHNYSKDAKHKAKDGLLISVKKQKDSSQVLMDDRPLDMKTSNERGIYLKKRKLKDWQESQNYLETLCSKGNRLPDGKVFLKQEKSESEIRKEKKSRVSKTEEKESSTSKGHDRSNKKGELTRILLPGSGNNPVDRSVKKDQHLRKHSSNILSQPTMDLGLERFSMAATSSSSKVSDSCKKASFQEVKGSPVESVSSSPMRIFNLDKLSPTRRGISGNDDAKNGGFPVIGTPKISLDWESNFESNRYGIPREGETTVVFHPESLGRPVLNFRDDVASSHKFVGKAESRVKPSSDFENSHLVNSDADTLTQHLPCPTDVHVSDHRHNEDTVNSKHCHNTVTFPQKSGNGSSLRPKDKGRSSANNFQKVTVKVSGPLGEQELNPKKILLDNARIDRHERASHCEESIDVKHRLYDEWDIKSNKDYKSVGKKGSGKRASDSRRGNLVNSDAKFGEPCSGDGRVTLPKNLIQDSVGEIAKKRDPTQVESRGGKSQVNPCHAGKQDTLAHARQPLSGSLKGSYSDVGLVDAAGDVDVSKVLKQPENSVRQNGANNSVGNPGPDPCVVSNCSAPSPVKKDTSSLMANNALKEAEDLREQADRLKLLQNSGFGFEYNEAYFQAALKFLHGASLLETCNSEHSKHGKMAQIQIYCTAAKLCESCVHEYEKRQEMAAAALAYKCMEVAYMRVVYCKSSSTNRDRHDLQASLQMVPQGESPSSSASDVDNLTNQATVDKAALSRGMGSHAGNQVIVARNRPNFVRLLDFTNDVNSAMEASRKSQNAFAAANPFLEEAQNMEGIISVKRVIDFSFRDIEKFVRLVQLAREAISRQGFSGNRD